ncbi:MAG TPA: ABC transporter permease subunit [Acidimicrobiales bacterium]|jgi:ABC-type nitrate/sulfonate/bicarbonate transport system permease component|nr:ABC transporter permease subunit [Acidimicrobiales bacterium]
MTIDALTGASLAPSGSGYSELTLGGEAGPESLALRAVRRIGKTLLAALLTIGVTLAVWQGFISVFHLNPYFAKGPSAVFDYLFTGPEAGASRHLVFSNLGVTLFDAFLGYVAGTLAAIGVSLAIVLSRSVEQTVMPVAIALRAVPIVAMTPVLVLIFGRGLLAVTIIAGVVSFFPTLVNLVFGLRSAPNHAFDLMRAYGASDAAILRKIQFPYGLTALFASAKIAVPGAIIGATLAEWLATGNGLGNLMLVSSSDSEWSTLWASVAIITITSVLIYNLVTLIERPVVERFRGVAVT